MKPHDDLWAFNLEFWLVIIILLLLGSMLPGCGGGSSSISAPANPDATLDASKWSFFFSPGMPEHPYPPLSFDFPSQDGVHYLLTGYDKPLTDKTAITAVIAIQSSPDAVFEYGYGINGNTCIVPASTRIMIEQRNDDLQASSGRWWSVAGLLLRDGSASLTVPLTPDAWSNVDGINGIVVPDQFAAALANVGNIGLTFGGGCFFGHGVFVSSGTASFTLTKFEVVS